jgi:hypothetical protein
LPVWLDRADHATADGHAVQRDLVNDVVAGGDQQVRRRAALRDREPQLVTATLPRGGQNPLTLLEREKIRRVPSEPSGCGLEAASSSALDVGDEVRILRWAIGHLYGHRHGRSPSRL